MRTPGLPLVDLLSCSSARPSYVVKFRHLFGLAACLCAQWLPEGAHLVASQTVNLPAPRLFTRHWNELPTPPSPPLFQMLADGFRSIEKLRDYISPEASSRRLASPTITSRISNHLLRFGIHPSDAIRLHGLIPALTAGQMILGT